MGDFYTEQLVKRQKASSTTLIIRNNWSGDHDRTGCFFVPEYGC